MKRRLALVALAATAVLVAADLVVQHVFLGAGSFRGRRVAPFDPPLFTPQQLERLEQYRRIAAGDAGVALGSHHDADLGWCSLPLEDLGRYRYDARGARIGEQPVPVERTPGVRRIVTVGCSFTLGQEVDGPETWPARVDAARADLEVVNLAYGFYGIDQALLRQRRDGAREHPDEVWLGILPSALPRILGTYPPAQRHWTGVVHVKPRFELDADGGLVLVPCPAATIGELVDLLSDQDRFLERVGAHDAWVRRSPAAFERLGASLWHRSGFARLLVTALEAGGREPRALVLDESSEIRRLASALVRELDREVRAGGARFRVVILPDRSDLGDRIAGGVAYWDGLVEELVAGGIEVLDTSAAFTAAGAASDDRFWAPEGHYSAAGNAVAATAVLAHVAARP